MRRGTLLVACVALSCDGVRAMKRPADDVTIAIERRVSARDEACEVRVLDAKCRIGPALVVTCEALPPREKLVATIRRCTWPGTGDELRRAVCRAGGDTIVHELSVTDSCIDEDLDSVRGTSLAFYSVYRLRPLP